MNTSSPRKQDPHSRHPSDLSSSELEHLVITDPDNLSARSEWLRRNGQAPAGSSTPAGSTHPLEEFQKQLHFDCPHCGGTLFFNPGMVGLECRHCGRIQMLDDVRVKPQDTALDLSNNIQSYRRAIARRVLRCQQCGALTVFPPGQISMICPYCDSGLFATAPEDEALVTPQILLPTHSDPALIGKAVKKWLAEGAFVPAGWSQASLQRSSLVYVPLWLISAALRFHDPNGPSLLGARDFLYIDWVVPGIPHLPVELVRALKPFNWKELVEFNPDYLARWPASHYEVSLEAALRTTRTELRQIARRRLPMHVSGTGTFYCQSYKLVLFPVWISGVKYQGQSYRLLINGQTGKVAGERPVSWARVIALTCGVALLLVLAALAALSGLQSWLPKIAITAQPLIQILNRVGILLIPAIAMLLLIFLIFKK